MGGHRQNANHDKFGATVQVACNQLLCVAMSFSPTCLATNVSVFAIIVHTNGVSKNLFVVREASEKVFIPTMRKLLIALSKPFHDYSGTNTDVIHDCYSTEYFATKNSVKPLKEERHKNVSSLNQDQVT